MSYVTYKNRHSSDYRFTVDSLDDPAVAQFKEFIRKENEYIKAARKHGFSWGQTPTKGLRIRPRGPRGSSWAYDTPIENATHFDVYVRDYK